MNNGVDFVLKNIEKTIKLIENNEEYNYLKAKVIREYYYLKSIKYTGNMYEYFLKFKESNHKYAKDFAFLKDFGILPNEEMADYLKDNYPEELNNFCRVEDLIVGNKYSNNEIASIFKCSNMGGMRRSKTTNSLVLIAKHTNPLYDDQWTEDGILNYTGMGTIGDQSINFGQNKTLAMSAQNNIKVYLFESYKENEYYYCGEVALCGNIYTDYEIDSDGNRRQVIKFPLKRVDGLSETIVNKEDIENSEKVKEKIVQKLSQDEIKDKIKNINPQVITKEVKSIYRERNQFISEYTKNRANGICDLCGKEAPFKDKNGNPYLESHHVITLAEGGPDVIYNTVAICPNCHRKIHILKDKKDILKLQKVILKYLLNEEDKESIEKYNELFEKNN